MATYRGDDIASPDPLNALLQLAGRGFQKPSNGPPGYEFGGWESAEPDYNPRPGQKGYDPHDQYAGPPAGGQSNALSLPPYQIPGSEPLAAAPPTDNLMAAIAKLNLTPQEKALYLRHLTNLYGQGGVDNPDGSRSTLYTANMPTDNGGGVNIPTVYDGQIISPENALVRAQQEGLQNFPSYPSQFAAENRYQQMHNFMDRDTGAYFRTKR